MHLNHKLFKGVSVQLHDSETAHETAKKLASIASVKRSWPIRMHTFPKYEGVTQVGDISAQNANGIKRRDNVTSPDTFTPHLLTQVDKLHALGITGKGVKIAIVDSGVGTQEPRIVLRMN